MKFYGNKEKNLVLITQGNTMLPFGEHLRDLHRDINSSPGAFSFAMTITMSNVGVPVNSPISEKEPFPEEYLGKTLSELEEAGVLTLLASSDEEFAALEL